MATAREKALNRARVAKHTRRKKERQERTHSMLGELVKKVERHPIITDDGEFIGYAYKVKADKDFEDRFAVWAAEHGRTGRQMLDEWMAVYLDEAQKMQDELN